VTITEAMAAIRAITYAIENIEDACDQVDDIGVESDLCTAMFDLKDAVRKILDDQMVDESAE